MPGPLDLGGGSRDQDMWVDSRDIMEMKSTELGYSLNMRK